MKIKQFNDYKILDYTSVYESALLQYNSIDLSKKNELLPKTNIFTNIDTYLTSMELIDKREEFINFIKENKDKKFCIIGDYDCDGICATVILVYALTLSGISVTYTTPDRFETGYGMKNEQVDTAIKNNADIIITVDNGIVANEAIDYAHKNNLKVVVTDHHTPQGTNNADIVINPLYNSDKFKTISGATVAMKLAYELYKEFKFDISFMYNFVALAGITCLSDVMPMLGENRLLVYSVVNYLNKEVYKHGSFINRLAKLVNFYDPKCESDPYLELPGTFKDFTKENIDFYLVPIINAVNRVIGNVDDLIYDIMSLFSNDFQGVPTFYYDLNNKRKFMKSELLTLHKRNKKHAVVEVLNPGKYEDDYSGIAGLVSSSVVENENKPALIGIQLDSDNVHFSGRSVSGFNLYQALMDIKEEHPELTFAFGGHAEALGATINKKEVPLVEEYLSEKFSKVDIQKIEQIALQINKIDIDSIIDLYNRFWPFGNKFEFPKLYCEGIPLFIDFNNICFTMDTTENIKIKYFSKKIKEKISDIIFNKKKETIKCILSIMKENDEIYFKLEKIL